MSQSDADAIPNLNEVPATRGLSRKPLAGRNPAKKRGVED
jgi:hypothetical protein